MRNDAVLILTHGRGDHVITEKALRRHGYTGVIYYIIDNEDDDEPIYRKNMEMRSFNSTREKQLKPQIRCHPVKRETQSYLREMSVGELQRNLD